MTLILTASELQALADMPGTITAVQRAFAGLSRGTAVQPAPDSLVLPSSDARFLPMAALSEAEGLASVKLLADIPANQLASLPTQRSTIMLVSQLTGETLAILDGKVPTRVRTAAASAVATKLLARPGSTTLGLIGAGSLAVAHVEAMLAVLPFDKVIVWSRSADTVSVFCDEVGHHRLNITRASSVREVVESADVLCTLTPAIEPLVRGEWFRPGLHVNAVGSRPRPDHREVDTTGMVRARVFVDSLATAKAKSGGLIIPVAEGAMSFEDVKGELGDVAAGTKEGRLGEEDITLFNSVGIGLQDLAIGRLLYDAALNQGIGTHVELNN
ncbi:ornithine cyclodeaminase family protein [Pseudarthrobacter sp. H3Y2-7]|uniref:ornithine cyclodeaminase family protein n=1 Tax=Pseudarthrobacter naphthalenicus TaxID=3031328 RepID=UPI0023B19B11|nr:ornithine cyclodeaminase family protein [Pseudarthrobacter sp. H3Y2-7]MDE8667726.1 ornithine cyclodeaminase family protein [Pseudarthrobacter sp. H3Y2-7]